MNYTESFDQFASRVSSMDLALYAGAALILFVLFQDKMGPVNTFIKNLLQKVSLSKESNNVINVTPIITPSISTNKEDLFFQLMGSWKQTRDLASRSNCTEAVKVADQMFPFLSPNSCDQTQTISNIKDK